MRLRLVVHNTDDLAGGYRAVCEFDESGGVIGSAADCDWQLGDRNGSVLAHHVRIEFVDKQFCLHTDHEKSLKINNSGTFIKPGQKVQITDGDRVHIGQFEISAFVEMTLDESDEIASRGERWARRFVSLGSLVDHTEEEVNARNLFESRPLRRQGNIEMYERMKQARQVDPVDLIEEQYESRSTFLKDPVALIDREFRAEKTEMATKLGNIINLEPEETGKAVEIPGDLQPGSAYMSLPGVQRRPPVQGESKPPRHEPEPQDRDSYLEQLALGARSSQEAEHTSIGDIAVRDRYLNDLEVAGIEEEQLVDHVVLRPFCIALGLPIQSMSVPRANQLAKDVGDAFRTAVEGLMKIQSMVDKSHVSQTHLHAIEDNPLRLNKPAEEVIRDLLLVKSPVHLSAEAAVEESLDFIRHHQLASETAAEEALDAVLRALGPSALAKRFRKYKGHAPRAGDPDAWHWEMYQHYYKEIRSEQQGGLSRMFWEVYRQVYDREMRNLTLEG